MITLLASLAMAGDPALELGLHALRDEWRAWSNRATPAERDADYAEACRRGWRPACDPGAWRDDAGHPDPERLAAALASPCEAGDALACFAAHRFGPTARFTTEALFAQCEDGLGPACTLVAEVLHDVDPERSRDLLRRACVGPEVDAPLGRDPLACGRYGERVDDAWLPDACEGGDGRACARLAAKHPEAAAGWEVAGCAGGDAPSCIAVAGAIEAALPADPSLEGVPDPANAERRTERHAALVRACGLGSVPGCTEAARDLALGRGVPVDEPAAHDGWWDACQRGDGAGCALLAEAILDHRTTAFGVTPRELYQRGCDLDDRPSCHHLRHFDAEQRFATRRLRANGYVRALPWIGVRPWIGGSAGITSELALPRVDAHAARRTVRLTAEQGAADFTFHGLDRRDTPENVTMFAADWRQDPVLDGPWGARLGIGSQWWQGAPRFGDDALLERIPGEATETDDLATFVSRLDLSRTARRDPRVGVQLSLSSTTAWATQERGAPEGTVGRAVLSVFQRAPSADPQPMRGGASELSVYVGAAVRHGGHAGIWLTDRRSIPLLVTRARRDALSLVSDFAAGVRRGDVPWWIAHQHLPRLSPNLGTWQLMQGQPAALMRGELPVRARAGLRWWIAEYHGLTQPLALYLTPFVEAGTVVPELARPIRTRWRSDGGLTATVTWRRRSALHLQALLVSDLEDGGFDLAPALWLQRVLEPWD